MKKNRAYMIEQIMEHAEMSKEKAEIVADVLDDHFVVGHNNKDKIRNDFMEKLNMDKEQANKLYNTCSEIIVKSVFRKK